jgi:hypothetical protein
MSKSIDKNKVERARLFKDARSIEITEHTLKKGCDLIREKMSKRKTNDAFLETTHNGEQIFVGWIAKWGNDYHVTFMGHTFAYANNFEDGVKALLQLGYALRQNDYTFHYGV